MSYLESSESILKCLELLISYQEKNQRFSFCERTDLGDGFQSVKIMGLGSMEYRFLAHEGKLIMLCTIIRYGNKKPLYIGESFPCEICSRLSNNSSEIYLEIKEKQKEKMTREEKKRAKYQSILDAHNRGEKLDFVSRL